GQAGGVHRDLVGRQARQLALGGGADAKHGGQGLIGNHEVPPMIQPASAMAPPRGGAAVASGTGVAENSHGGRMCAGIAPRAAATLPAAATWGSASNCG